METKRLLVVDPVGNYGGSTRFVRRLLPALRRVRPTLEVVFLGDRISIEREGIESELRDSGVEVRELTSLHPPPWKSRPLLYRLGYKLRRRFPTPDFISAFDLEANLLQEIAVAADQSDVAYFPWPQGVDVPSTSVALVTTIHDLNFKYFFGAPNFDPEQVATLDRRIGGWLSAGSYVTSSRFMASELQRFYPDLPQAPVVRLAPFSDLRRVEPEAAQAIVAALGIRPPYVLCPTHPSIHKNLGPLIAAHHLLTRRRPELRLVVTGEGTEAATGVASPIGSVRAGIDPDVIGIGYVSHQEIDSLIQCASVVVNPSLYEAGNGPALDAWAQGTPVAMSAIPSFQEHLDELGVSASLFDPRDPSDIAEKLDDILRDETSWRDASSASPLLHALTWEGVARGYLDVFDAAYGKAVR